MNGRVDWDYKMILSDFVSADANVARSINIERDMGDNTSLQ